MRLQKELKKQTIPWPGAFFPEVKGSSKQVFRAQVEILGRGEPQLLLPMHILGAASMAPPKCSEGSSAAFLTRGA